jgi:hypothetical protein
VVQVSFRNGGIILVDVFLGIHEGPFGFGSNVLILDDFGNLFGRLVEGFFGVGVDQFLDVRNSVLQF